MMRFRCLLCGRIVEYLRVYGQGKEKPPHKCNCGGDLVPIHTNVDDFKGGISNENRYASQKRTSE